MSVMDTVIGWTRHLASRTAHAIVHPVETAGDVVERAGSVAASAASVVVSATKEAEKDPADWAAAVQQEDAAPVTPAPQPVEDALAAEARLGDEPAFTEPKPSDVDDWRDELDEPELDDVPEPPRAEDDTPLLDPSIAKSVRHESETMRRAAERNPQDQDVH